NTVKPTFMHGTPLHDGKIGYRLCTEIQYRLCTEIQKYRNTVPFMHRNTVKCINTEIQKYRVIEPVFFKKYRVIEPNYSTVYAQKYRYDISHHFYAHESIQKYRNTEIQKYRYDIFTPFFMRMSRFSKCINTEIQKYSTVYAQKYRNTVNA
ncbi:hypothetical protein L9F63_014549, partial [Diploptera punctata]